MKTTRALALGIDVNRLMRPRFIIGAGVTDIDGRVSPYNLIRPGATIELASGTYYLAKIEVNSTGTEIGA